MEFSTVVNRNSGAGVERLVAVLEARVWSGLGMLERLILGPGVFRGEFFYFPPPVGSVEGQGYPARRQNCWAPCFFFTKWAGDVR